MKRLIALILIVSSVSCKETELIPYQRTLNGTSWRKFEFRKGERDVFKILSFRPPNIVNISVRDDKGYLVNSFQEEYTYIYEHPNFQVEGPFNLPFKGSLVTETQMEFQGEMFFKSSKP